MMSWWGGVTWASVYGNFVMNMSRNWKPVEGFQKCNELVSVHDLGQVTTRASIFWILCIRARRLSEMPNRKALAKSNKGGTGVPEMRLVAVLVRVGRMWRNELQDWDVDWVELWVQLSVSHSFHGWIMPIRWITKNNLLFSEQDRMPVLHMVHMAYGEFDSSSQKFIITKKVNFQRQSPANFDQWSEANKYLCCR